MNFEASGNLSDWPPNVAGEPTQAAVFALQVEQTRLRSTILWKAEFEDLQKAMYWAAKKEIEGVRRGGHSVVSRVLWQHDLTPEQAVEACRKQMEPQLVPAYNSAKETGDFDLGEGPMQPVDPKKAQGYYVEIEGLHGEDAVKPFFIPLDGSN
jgi:hypothetical protein